MKNLLPILFVFLLVSCTSNNKGETETTAAPTETMPATPTTPVNNLRDQAVHLFEGRIPCGDCEGIDYSINLSADSLYNDTMKYIGRKVDPFTNNGTWKIDGKGMVTITPASSGSSSQYLLFNGDYLEMVNADGKLMDSINNYKLLKK